MNILNEIAAKTKERIQKEKLEIPEKDLIQMIQKRKVQMLLHPEQQSITSRTPHSFYQALKKEGMSYICEVKKHLLPKVSLHRLFLIWRLQKNIRKQEQQRFPV